MACSELGAIPRRVRCCACGEGACSLRRPDNQPLSDCHPAIQRWELACSWKRPGSRPGGWIRPGTYPFLR